MKNTYKSKKTKNKKTFIIRICALVINVFICTKLSLKVPFAPSHAPSQNTPHVQAIFYEGIVDACTPAQLLNRQTLMLIILIVIFHDTSHFILVQPIIFSLKCFASDKAASAQCDVQHICIGIQTVLMTEEPAVTNNDVIKQGDTEVHGRVTITALWAALRRQHRALSIAYIYDRGYTRLQVSVSWSLKTPRTKRLA